jgi:Domain of unknown function (DU1801)
MQSKAQTVDAYLAEQTPERRAELESMRRFLRENLDPRIAEGMSYGMIGYWVPFEVYPHGYHCTPDKPLPFAGLAAQKQHFSLYLLAMYMNPDAAQRFERDWQAAGKKLDMGKSCIRFKRSADLAMDVLKKHLRLLDLDAFIAQYTALYGPDANTQPKRKPAAQAAKPSAKPTTQRANAKPAADKAPALKKQQSAALTRSAKKAKTTEVKAQAPRAAQPKQATPTPTAPRRSKAPSRTKTANAAHSPKPKQQPRRGY